MVAGLWHKPLESLFEKSSEDGWGRGGFHLVLEEFEFELSLSFFIPNKLLNHLMVLPIGCSVWGLGRILVQVEVWKLTYKNTNKSQFIKTKENASWKTTLHDKNTPLEHGVKHGKQNQTILK